MGDFPNIMLVFRGVVVLVCWWNASGGRFPPSKHDVLKEGVAEQIRVVQQVDTSFTCKHRTVWQFFVAFFGMVKSPYPRLSYFQLGEKKATVNLEVTAF